MTNGRRSTSVCRYNVVIDVEHTRAKVPDTIVRRWPVSATEKFIDSCG
jgi:hypothetical protein